MKDQYSDSFDKIRASEAERRKNMPNDKKMSAIDILKLQDLDFIGTARIERGKHLKKTKGIDKSYSNFMVNAFLNMGILEKPESCSKCNTRSKNIYAHHENYFSPLSIEWLCSPCHQSRHHELRRQGRDPSDCFYRRILESPSGDSYLNRLRQFYTQVAELSAGLFDEDSLDSPNVFESTPILSISYKAEAIEKPLNNQME